MKRCSWFKVPTDACPTTGVHGHACGTLAEEGALSVHTLPVDAHPGEHLTLVYIWPSKGRTDTDFTIGCCLVLAYVLIRLSLVYHQRS